MDKQRIKYSKRDRSFPWRPTLVQLPVTREIRTSRPDLPRGTEFHRARCLGANLRPPRMFIRERLRIIRGVS